MLCHNGKAGDFIQIITDVTLQLVTSDLIRDLLIFMNIFNLGSRSEPGKTIRLNFVKCG